MIDIKLQFTPSFLRYSRLCMAVAPALMLALAGCGSKAKSASDSDSATQASAVDSLPQLTPDLRWKELHGPVHSCVLEFYDMADPKSVSADSVVFNADGSLASLTTFTSFDGKRSKATDIIFSYDSNGNAVKGTDKAADMQVSIVRGPEGEILSWQYAPADGSDSDGSYTEDYSWNEQGLPRRLEITGWEWNASTSYSYDDKGQRTKAVTKSEDIDYESTDTQVYTYKQFDSRGNWTEREVSVSRHENDEGRETDSRSIRVERRRIHYLK